MTSAGPDARRQAAEERCKDWRQRREQVNEDRDPVVLDAHAAGISKHRIHLLTGLARTTIDDILPAEPRELAI